VVDKGKSKVVDKGKGKVTEPKKPAFIPLWTSEALKIESRGPAPQAQPTAKLVKKTSSLEKRQADTPPHVARVLKLIDEFEDLRLSNLSRPPRDQFRSFRLLVRSRMLR
jgi:hypothetical protein